MSAANIIPWKYKVINANGATPIGGGPLIYGGYKILGAAGAHTLDVYDHASSATGQKLESALSVNTAADKEYVGGIEALNGLTVNLSGDPTDGLILVRYR